MRKISALIAATLCTLALLGGAFGLDGRSLRPTVTLPGWLEFRTALAAENLWPRQAPKVKSGREVQRPYGAEEAAALPTAPFNRSAVVVARR